MGKNIGMMRRERPREMRNYFYKKADPCKIFVGNISPEAREEDVRRKFLKYGDIVNMQWKTRFAFIEYEKTSHAEIAIKEENGQLFFGEELNVQPHHAGNYFNNRSDNRNYYPPTYGRNYSPNRNEIREKKNALRIVIRNVDEKASWQDLKDFGRDIGSVNYANIFQNENKERFGIIEYYNYENVKKAVEVLNGRKFNGITVEVMKFCDSPLNLKLRNGGEDKKDGNSYHHYSGDKDRIYHRDGYDAERDGYRRDRFFERPHDRDDRRDEGHDRNKFGRDEKEDEQHDKSDRDHRRGSMNSDRGRDDSQDKERADGVGGGNREGRDDGNDMERQSQLSGRRGNSKDKEDNFGEADRLSRKSGSSARSGNNMKDKYNSGGRGVTDGMKQGRNKKNERSQSADNVGEDQRTSMKGKDKEDEYSVDKEREEAIKNDRELSTRGDDEDENMYRSDEEGSVLGSTNVRDKIEQNADGDLKDGQADRYDRSRSRSRSVSVKAKYQSRKRNTKGRRKGRRGSEDSSSRRDLQDSYYDNNSNNEKWATSKKVCVDKANSTESGS